MSLGHCLLSITKCTLRSLVDMSSRKAQKHFQLFQSMTGILPACA